MGKKADLKSQLKIFKKELHKHYPVRRMIFFGSRISGKAAKGSDIDLLIVSPKFRGLDFIERGSKMYDYWNLKYPVDFLCYTPEEFKTLSRRVTIVKEAVESGADI